MSTPFNKFNPDWDMNAVLVEEIQRISGEFARSRELLRECENEMTYSDWAVTHSDNPRRNDLYKKIWQFNDRFLQQREWAGLSPEDFAGLRSRIDPQQVNDFVFADIVAMTQAKLRELNA